LIGVDQLPVGKPDLAAVAAKQLPPDSPIGRCSAWSVCVPS